MDEPKDNWIVLSGWLDRALDLEPPARAALLAELAATDPALARELEAMLASTAELAVSGFLEESLLPNSPTLAGQRMGPWVLESHLGQGGMGSVWLARRNDGRYEGVAAVKLLNLALMGAAGEERFRREGSILARLTHPNIARLIDAGVSVAGQPYLVLEYIAGEPIDVYCDSKALDIRARLRLFLDVLAAVGDAHSHLIVHRDIKPSNVLVTANGDVKLLDFGIAKLIDTSPASGEATELTRAHGSALTPQFAAPEQLLGAPITTATDVYSLAVVLYFLLAGHSPVGPITHSALELSRAIIETDPPRLSDVVIDTRNREADEVAGIAARRASSPLKLKRLLQGDLDNILAKALKKHPRERYVSVAAFADDLERFLRDEPVSARPDSLAYRAGKFVQRNRGGVIAAGLIAAAIVAGVIGTITQAHRAAEQATLARHQRDVALRELTYAEAADEFMRFLLSESSTKPFKTVELLARAEALVDKQFSGDPDLRARLQLTVADLYGEVLDFKRAEFVLQQAQASARQGGNESLRAQIDCTMASLHSAVGDLKGVPALFDDSIHRLKTAADPQASAIAECLEQHSIHLRDQGDARASLEEAQEALRTLATPRPGQRVTDVSVHSSIADAYNILGDYPRAVDAYRTALDEYTSLGRERTTAALTLANNLGVCLARAGQLLQASEVYRRALDAVPAEEDLARHLLGTNYAKTLVELGRTRDALPLFESAVASARASGNTRALAFTSLYAAAAWCAEGEVERCGKLLQSADEALKSALPPAHYVFGVAAMTGATLELEKHDLEGARADLMRALAIFDAATEKSPARIHALTMLARLQRQTGDLPTARRTAQQSVDAAQAVSKGFAQSEWLGSAMLALGLVEAAQHDKPQAQIALRTALAQLVPSAGEDAPSTREARAALAAL